ncbi:MAG: hypothetical protein LAT82_02790 [Nanoarchaeota archaeon]|nr:hypothetical protein [Nanoarchaeota archaeon]
MVTKKHHEKDAKHNSSTHKREPLRTSSSSHAKKDDTYTKKSSSKETTNSSQLQILIGAAVVGLLVIVLIIVVMMALNSNNSGQNETLDSSLISNQTTTLPQEELVNNTQEVDPLTPILNVNGDDVLAQDIVMVQMQLQNQGFQVTQEDALEQVITNIVLLQAVQRENFEISNEEAEEELVQLLQTQGFTLDELKTDLQEQGISYEATLEDFKERVAVDRFLSQNIDENLVQVTQEEVEEFYAQYAIQMGENTPAFEEIELQIIAQLEQDKLRQLQTALINELIEEADIEFY